MSEWTESSAKEAAAHIDDPRVAAAFQTLVGHIGGALTNLARLGAEHASRPQARQRDGSVQ